MQSKARTHTDAISLFIYFILKQKCIINNLTSLSPGGAFNKQLR